jgi:hypothetical protein
MEYVSYILTVTVILFSSGCGTQPWTGPDPWGDLAPPGQPATGDAMGHTSEAELAGVSTVSAGVVPFQSNTQYIYLPVQIQTSMTIAPGS